MKRTAQEFKEISKNKHITAWCIGACDNCFSSLIWRFEEGQPLVENNCVCLKHIEKIKIKSWQEVADFYNNQKDPMIISFYDEFWGFSN